MCVFFSFLFFQLIFRVCNCKVVLYLQTSNSFDYIRSCLIADVLLLMYVVRLVVFFNVVFIQQPCFGTTIPRDLIPCSILFTFVCIFIMYKLAVKKPCLFVEHSVKAKN